jgi:hypothetical protein
MPRLLSAVHEWLELRARMREERQFHLDRAAADLRALGLTRREAKRRARTRFGSRRNSQRGLRELGGDWQGLAHLFRAHRVATSLWFQPALLLSVIAVILAVSPSRREMMEGMLGHRFDAEDHRAVSLAVYGAGPASPGITQTELDALQTMRTATSVESSGPHEAMGQPMPGVTLAAITSEARIRTGDRGFYAAWVFPQPRVMTSPAKVIWLLIALYGAFFLYRRTGGRVKPQWLLYAISVGCLHALASIFGWALTIQLWNCAALQAQMPTAAGLAFSLLAITYLLVAAVQCGYWWRDLRHRCPVCLDCLLLSWTQGETHRVLLSAAVTESVCAHGHGVMVESRWSRDFRHEDSPLGLARV